MQNHPRQHVWAVRQCVLAGIRSLPAIIVLACSGTLLVFASPARAQWSESFDTPETSWWQYSKSSHYQLRNTKRVFENAKEGTGFERLTVVQRGKTPVQLAHRVDPMRVIDELIIRLWVRSGRVGAKLGARLTLPETIDKKTGERFSVVILGPEIKEANRWTLLKLEGISSLLQKQLPTLRSTGQQRIDVAGAYLDLIVIEDGPGLGENQICVDGLTIDGMVPLDAQKIRPRTSTKSSSKKVIEKTLGFGKPPHIVKAAGGVLEVDDLPAFVRSIQSSGESLEFLKSLGFNAVELPQPPTLAQDEEAVRLNLWLIAPPAYDPRDQQKQRTFASVIAWNLGDDLTDSELEAARKYISESRSQASDSTPIFIGGAKSHLWEWSRLVDLLVVDAGGPLTANELGESANRVVDFRGQGRPGIPSFATIHTEPPPALISQVRTFSPANNVPLCVAPEQLRLQAMHGVMGGARGLIFKSRSRLDGKSTEDELRAASLKWLNLQLDVLTPWAATGDASVLSDTNEQTLVGAIKSDRATLYVLTDQSPHCQFESLGTYHKITNTSISNLYDRAPRYQLTWRVIRQLSVSASRSGTKFPIERTGNVDYLMIADDQAALRFAAETMEQRRSEMATTQLQVASLWLQHNQMTLASQQGPLAPAEKLLVKASQSLSKGDEFQTLSESEEVMRHIARTRHGLWSKMTASLPNPLISPLCVSADLLDAHSELTRRISQQQWTTNRVPGGELESVDSLQDSGWLAFQTPDTDFETTISPCDQSPHAGNAALSLTSTKLNPGAGRLKSTVAITTPGAPVRRGDLVRYRVWLRKSESNTSSHSRVQLFDSLGGRSLAFQVEPVDQWAPSTFYRFAPADGEASLTLSLQGPGAIDVDSIEIQTLSQDQLEPANLTSR